MGEVTIVNCGKGLVFEDPNHWQLNFKKLAGQGEHGFRRWSRLLTLGTLPNSMVISGQHSNIHLEASAIQLIAANAVNLNPELVSSGFFRGNQCFTAAQLVTVSGKMKRVYIKKELQGLQEAVREPLQDKHTFSLVHARCSSEEAVAEWVKSQRSIHEQTDLLENIRTVYENFQKLGLENAFPRKALQACFKRWCSAVSRQSGSLLGDREFIERIPSLLITVQKVTGSQVPWQHKSALVRLYAEVAADEPARKIEMTLPKGVSPVKANRIGRLTIESTKESFDQSWIMRAGYLASLCGVSTLTLKSDQECMLTADCFAGIPEVYSGLEFINVSVEGEIDDSARLAQFSHLLAQGHFADQVAKWIAKKGDVRLKSLKLCPLNEFPSNFARVPQLGRLILDFSQSHASFFYLEDSQIQKIPSTLDKLEVTGDRWKVSSLLNNLPEMPRLERLLLQVYRLVSWESVHSFGLLEKMPKWPALQSLSLRGDIHPADLGESKSEWKGEMWIRPQWLQSDLLEGTNPVELQKQMAGIATALGVRKGVVQPALDGKEIKKIRLPYNPGGGRKWVRRRG